MAFCRPSARDGPTNAPASTSAVASSGRVGGRTGNRGRDTASLHAVRFAERRCARWWPKLAAGLPQDLRGTCRPPFVANAGRFVSFLGNHASHGLVLPANHRRGPIGHRWGETRRPWISSVRGSCTLRLVSWRSTDQRPIMPQSPLSAIGAARRSVRGRRGDDRLASNGLFLSRQCGCCCGYHDTFDSWNTIT